MKKDQRTGASRRSFMGGSAILMASSSLVASAQPWPDKENSTHPNVGRGVQPVVPLKTEQFSPADVRLLDGPFKDSRDAAARYLLSLEVDRLLAPYRSGAGLREKASRYPGWETEFTPGYSLALYLAGISRLAVNMDGWQSQEFQRRVDYILDELEACQQATGGYLHGAPKGRELFAEIERGIDGYAKWQQALFVNAGGQSELYYCLAKTFAGLRDAYRIAGRRKALQIEVRLGNWLAQHMSRLSDAQIADILTWLYGESAELNWVLSDLYADTGDRRFMALSHRWHDHSVFDGLAAGKDNLTGVHGNAQFPKFSGLAARYPYSNDSADLRTASFFWECVARHRSYATGGNSNFERLWGPDQLDRQLSQYTAENCNEYNMLKLTQLLFNIQPKPEYAEYLERTLFNHILSAQDPRDGSICYFLPLMSCCSRTPESLYGIFSCCVGSSMDSYTRFPEYIYSFGNDGLYVKLFVASEVSWKEKGLALRQETSFPDEGFSTLKFSLSKPEKFLLYLRYPSWCTTGFAVEVNGVAQAVSTERGGFFALDREWHDRDTVIVRLPLRLRHEAMPDNENRIAFFAGPILLAGNLGSISDPSIDDPATFPLLVSANAASDSWLQATGAPLTFVTTVARPRQIVLQPFFRQRDCSYGIYWDRVTPSGWQAHLDEVKQLRLQSQQLEQRTVDKVIAGDLGSEAPHQFEVNGGEFGRGIRGYAMHLSWRLGPSITYRMKVPKGDKAAIWLRCFDSGTSHLREFEVQLNGKTIGREQCAKIPDGFVVEYPIPADLLHGANDLAVTVNFPGYRHDGWDLRLSEVRVLNSAV